MATIADILADHAGREGPLLPILHDVQKAFDARDCSVAQCNAR
jgi:hypothetical protein